MHTPQSNPFPSLFMVLGFIVLLAGIWWLSRPAALIVAGLYLMAVGFIGRSGRSADF